MITTDKVVILNRLFLRIVEKRLLDVYHKVLDNLHNIYTPRPPLISFTRETSAQDPPLFFGKQYFLCCKDPEGSQFEKLLIGKIRGIRLMSMQTLLHQSNSPISFSFFKIKKITEEFDEQELEGMVVRYGDKVKIESKLLSRRFEINDSDTNHSGYTVVLAKTKQKLSEFRIRGQRLTGEIAHQSDKLIFQSIHLPNYFLYFPSSSSVSVSCTNATKIWLLSSYKKSQGRGIYSYQIVVAKNAKGKLTTQQNELVFSPAVICQTLDEHSDKQQLEFIKSQSQKASALQYQSVSQSCISARGMWIVVPVSGTAHIRRLLNQTVTLKSLITQQFLCFSNGKYITGTNSNLVVQFSLELKGNLFYCIPLFQPQSESLWLNVAQPRPELIFNAIILKEISNQAVEFMLILQSWGLEHARDNIYFEVRDKALKNQASVRRSLQDFINCIDFLIEFLNDSESFSASQVKQLYSRENQILRVLVVLAVLTSARGKLIRRSQSRRRSGQLLSDPLRNLFAKLLNGIMVFSELKSEINFDMEKYMGFLSRHLEDFGEAVTGIIIFIINRSPAIKRDLSCVYLDYWLSKIQQLSYKNNNYLVQCNLLRIIAAFMKDSEGRYNFMNQDRCAFAMFSRVKGRSSKCFIRFISHRSQPYVVLYQKSSLRQFKQENQWLGNYCVEGFQEPVFNLRELTASKEEQMDQLCLYIKQLVSLLQKLCQGRNKKIAKKVQALGVNSAEIIRVFTDPQINTRLKQVYMGLYIKLYLDTDPYISLHKSFSESVLQAQLLKSPLTARACLLFELSIENKSAAQDFQDFDNLVRPFIEESLESSESMSKLDELLEDQLVNLRKIIELIRVSIEFGMLSFKKACELYSKVLKRVRIDDNQFLKMRNPKCRVYPLLGAIIQETVRLISVFSLLKQKFIAHSFIQQFLRAARTNQLDIRPCTSLPSLLTLFDVRKLSIGSLQSQISQLQTFPNERTYVLRLIFQHIVVLPNLIRRSLISLYNQLLQFQVQVFNRMKQSLILVNQVQSQAKEYVSGKSKNMQSLSPHRLQAKVDIIHRMLNSHSAKHEQIVSQGLQVNNILSKVLNRFDELRHNERQLRALQCMLRHYRFHLIVLKFLSLRAQNKVMQQLTSFSISFLLKFIKNNPHNHQIIRLYFRLILSHHTQSNDWPLLVFELISQDASLSLQQMELKVTLVLELLKNGKLASRKPILQVLQGTIMRVKRLSPKAKINIFRVICSFCQVNKKFEYEQAQEDIQQVLIVLACSQPRIRDQLRKYICMENNLKLLADTNIGYYHRLRILQLFSVLWIDELRQYHLQPFFGLAKVELKKFSSNALGLMQPQLMHSILSKIDEQPLIRKESRCQTLKSQATQSIIQNYHVIELSKTDLRKLKTQNISKSLMGITSPQQAFVETQQALPYWHFLFGKIGDFENCYGLLGLISQLLSQQLQEIRTGETQILKLLVKLANFLKQVQQQCELPTNLYQLMLFNTILSFKFKPNSQDKKAQKLSRTKIMVSFYDALIKLSRLRGFKPDQMINFFPNESRIEGSRFLQRLKELGEGWQQLSQLFECEMVQQFFQLFTDNNWVNTAKFKKWFFDYVQSRRENFKTEENQIQPLFQSYVQELQAHIPTLQASLLAQHIDQIFEFSDIKLMLGDTALMILQEQDKTQLLKMLQLLLSKMISGQIRQRQIPGEILLLLDVLYSEGLFSRMSLVMQKMMSIFGDYFIPTLRQFIQHNPHFDLFSVLSFRLSELNQLYMSHDPALHQAKAHQEMHSITILVDVIINMDSPAEQSLKVTFRLLLLLIEKIFNCLKEGKVGLTSISLLKGLLALTDKLMSFKQEYVGQLFEDKASCQLIKQIILQPIQFMYNFKNVKMIELTTTVLNLLLVGSFRRNDQYLKFMLSLPVDRIAQHLIQLYREIQFHFLHEDQCNFWQQLTQVWFQKGFLLQLIGQLYIANKSFFINQVSKGQLQYLATLVCGRMSDCLEQHLEPLNFYMRFRVKFRTEETTVRLRRSAVFFYETRTMREQLQSRISEEICNRQGTQVVLIYHQQYMHWLEWQRFIYNQFRGLVVLQAYSPYISAVNSLLSLVFAVTIVFSKPPFSVVRYLSVVSLLLALLQNSAYIIKFFMYKRLSSLQLRTLFKLLGKVFFWMIYVMICLVSTVYPAIYVILPALHLCFYMSGYMKDCLLILKNILLLSLSLFLWILTVTSLSYNGTVSTVPMTQFFLERGCIIAGQCKLTESLPDIQVFWLMVGYTGNQCFIYLIVSFIISQFSTNFNRTKLQQCPFCMQGVHSQNLQCEWNILYVLDSLDRQPQAVKIKVDKIKKRLL